MMSISDEAIRAHSMARLASIFHLAVQEIRLEMRFSSDFEAADATDFKFNEFDRVNDDLRGVADRRITSELNSGALVINTVDDYCNHMIRCYRVKPKDVISLLGM